VTTLGTLYAAMTRRRRRQLALTAVAMLAGAVAELVTIGAVFPFLALLTHRAGGTGGSVWSRIPLAGIDSPAAAAAILVAAALTAAAVRLGLLWMSQRLVNGFAHDLARAMFGRMLRQPYADYVRRNSSEVLASIEKVRDIAGQVLQPLMQAAIATVMALFIGAFLFVLSPAAAAGAGVSLALVYLAISRLTRHRLSANSRVIATAATERVKIVQEALGGLRDIILDRSHGVFEEEFSSIDARLRKALSVNAMIGQGPRFAIEAAGIVAIAIVALWMSAEAGGIVAALPALGALALGAQRLLPLLQQAYLGWSGTLGNRQATQFYPAPGVGDRDLADAAQLASLADETPEGRSIVVLAKDKYGIRERDVQKLGATFVAFTAQTRMSGVNMNGRQVRKGAADAIEAHVKALGGSVPPEVRNAVDTIAKAGATPLVVADGARVLGAIQLKDIVKGGIRERFGELRRMGIRTVMITGDNPLTAAAIAAEAGIDDFLAEATPETKLKLIRDMQGQGRLVAMTGDGTNDAPALAQADVAVAMNSGTQAAKEAGNMVDLDSNPTKLLEVVETGKQMLMTRGALTTFSIANDVAKYFAIIPAAFAITYPALGALNIVRLATPESAILSAVIFNALIIVALIPLALKGVRYRAIGAAAVLRRHVWIYGVGGIIVPFPGIKLVDMILVALGLV